MAGKARRRCASLSTLLFPRPGAWFLLRHFVSQATGRRSQGSRNLTVGTPLIYFPVRYIASSTQRQTAGCCYLRVA
ncbi:hypothetical protein CKAH01_02055 [Colletotrichum kahawae]|uniref:Uncharacterized protein n=1 Tax=Colletotrichum kahawae TaxID=34407 RepID=A0AAD9Y1T8_COLKA|nr:hypothetical protein CKAH01_02055 [Colletotrichum kahawae]